MMVLAGTVAAQPAARGSSAGAALQQGEPGTKATGPAGTMIEGNGAAINYPTVDSAFATSDGIAVPLAANQSPGRQRLTDLAQTSTVLTTGGDVRLTRLIGAGVFASSGERLGTVRDILLSRSAEPQVIVATDQRLVEVAWSQLDFGRPGSELHGKAVLPGETPHGLEQLPAFSPARLKGRGLIAGRR